MGTFRIYADKTNCILEDQPTKNTGNNEVAELWYGENGVSRFLVRFDLTDYTTYLDSGIIPSGATATLNLKSMPTLDTLEAEMATSFELEVYSADTEWHEGNGYAFNNPDSIADYSNWNSATTVIAWQTPGGDYSTLFGSQTFDKGDEDIALELPSDLLSESWQTSNNGILVKFSAAHEALTGSTQQIKKIFTRHTNTLYDPYIELEWDSTIRDNSDEIYEENAVKLFCYITSGGELSDPVSVESCNVYSGDPIGLVSGYTSPDIQKHDIGVYFVDFVGTDLPENTDITIYWNITPLKSGGRSITLTSSTTTIGDPWTNTSSPSHSATNYMLTMPNLEGSYTQGERRNITVLAREQYQSSTTVLKDLEYRIIIKDGTITHGIVPWTDVNYSSGENFIALDTTWMPTGQTYNLELRYNGNDIIYNEDAFTERKFKVL